MTQLKVNLLVKYKGTKCSLAFLVINWDWSVLLVMQFTVTGKGKLRDTISSEGLCYWYPYLNGKIWRMTLKQSARLKKCTVMMWRNWIFWWASWQRRRSRALPSVRLLLSFSFSWLQGKHKIYTYNALRKNKKKIIF